MWKKKLKYSYKSFLLTLTLYAYPTDKKFPKEKLFWAWVYMAFSSRKKGQFK